MSKIILGACGDISFKGNLEQHIREKGIEFAFENVKEHLTRADILFGNAESVMLPDTFADRESGLICSDAVAQCYRDAGFDILNVANNHLLDRGSYGLLHTVDIISNLGIKLLGGGRNEQEASSMQIIEKDGVIFGFLGYQEPNNCTYEGGAGRMNYFRLQQATEDVKRYRDQVDILIVSFHGDMEFNPSPSLLKVDFCKQLADNGADIILCHHPHVPQGIELYGESLIVYSLGNFAFNIDGGYMMHGYPHTSRSHILYIEIENGRISNWYREYFRISKEEGRPCLLTEEQWNEENEYYCYLDNILKDPVKLRQMWYEACIRYLNIYWNNLLRSTPEDFMKHLALEIFCVTENQHWVDGLKELVQQQYGTYKAQDTVFTRPNKPGQPVL